MANLVELIESYLKKLLEETDEIEIQRKELANHFACVPSQINYVLQTRFSIERGYIIESRRGGGGYIRITKLHLHRPEDMSMILEQGIGEAISQDHASALVHRLVERNLITLREAKLLQKAVSQDILNACMFGETYLRASLLKALLLVIMQPSFQNDQNGKEK